RVEHEVAVVGDRDEGAGHPAVLERLEPDEPAAPGRPGPPGVQPLLPGAQTTTPGEEHGSTYRKGGHANQVVESASESSRRQSREAMRGIMHTPKPGASTAANLCRHLGRRLRRRWHSFPLSSWTPFGGGRTAFGARGGLLGQAVADLLEVAP